MDRRVLTDIYNFHLDTNNKADGEKISTSIFVLATAITEAANDICEALGALKKEQGE